MPTRLVLWDIDGTLLRSGDVGRDVFSKAMEHAVGRHPGDHGVRMGGKTDPQIALEILAAMGLEGEDGEVHVDPVLERLEVELSGSVERMRAEGWALPGVVELLSTLARPDSGVAQSVLTGNTAANAVVKLAAFGLDRWLDLDIGAYGSDHRDRRELVPVARARAEIERGWTFGPGQIWVVGDTPNDLACAAAGGARCLLVATGAASLDTLSALAADAVFADLSDVDRVIDLLRS